MNLLKWHTATFMNDSWTDIHHISCIKDKKVKSYKINISKQKLMQGMAFIHCLVLKFRKLD